MAYYQSFCHIGEVADDLELTSAYKVNRLYDRVMSASMWLSGKRALSGDFVPLTATRRFDGPPDRKTLWIDPLLALTSIIDDTTTLASSDYLIYPRQRWWENGPYTRIEIDPDAASLSAWTREKDIIVIAGRWGKYEQSIATGTTIANVTEISAGGTSLIVSDGTAIFPGMILLIESEQLLVKEASDLAAATFTVERGINGTTGSTHANGVAISRYIAPWDVNYLARQIAALMHKKAKSGFAGKTGNADLGEVFYHKEFPRDVLEDVQSNYRIGSL